MSSRVWICASKSAMHLPLRFSSVRVNSKGRATNFRFDQPSSRAFADLGGHLRPRAIFNFSIDHFCRNRAGGDADIARGFTALRGGHGVGHGASGIKATGDVRRAGGGRVSRRFAQLTCGPLGGTQNIWQYKTQVAESPAFGENSK